MYNQNIFAVFCNFVEVYESEALNLVGLYNRIEYLCAERGITVTQMCRDVGLARTLLSELKAGRIKNIGTDKLERIATYFGVSTDYLLGIEQEKKPTVIDDGLDEKLDDLVKKFRAAPLDVQELVLHTLSVEFPPAKRRRGE